MNLNDLQTTWYTKGELKNIKREMSSDISKMIRGDKVTESNTQTARGLVYRTRQVSYRRKQKNSMARRAVLDEQQRQLLVGERDDELVANAYLRASTHCQAEAYSVGSEDEAAVKKELEEMRRTHKRRNTGDYKINVYGTKGLLMQLISLRSSRLSI
jgi:hypothetical protein